MLSLLQFSKLGWDTLVPGLRNRVPRTLLAIEFQDGFVKAFSLRKSNGGVSVQGQASFPLALNFSTEDPLLIGQEIKRGLEAAGIKGKRCVVCLPMRWVITYSFPIPQGVPEEDLMSFCEFEVERELPYQRDSLYLQYLISRVSESERICTALGVLKTDVERLENILIKAGLKPLSFSVGLIFIQRPEHTDEPVIAIYPARDILGITIASKDGIYAIRAIEGDTQFGLDVEHVVRELRLTVGQLPIEIQEKVRKIRIFGEAPHCKNLVEALASKLGRDFEVALSDKLQFPSALPPYACVAHAASMLTGHGVVAEFLPPRISIFEQAINRYFRGKLLKVGAAAGAIAAIVAILFVIQQSRLMYWSSKWAAIEGQVQSVESLQQNIKKWRPWFDTSFRTLMVLKRLSEAFPEEGTVSLRTLEIRDGTLVICSGTARDNTSLLRVLDRLRSANEITSVHVDQTRGDSPVQFTFKFEWTPRQPQLAQTQK